MRPQRIRFAVNGYPRCLRQDRRSDQSHNGFFHTRLTFVILSKINQSTCKTYSASNIILRTQKEKPKRALSWSSMIEVEFKSSPNMMKPYGGVATCTIHNVLQCCKCRVWNFDFEGWAMTCVLFQYNLCFQTYTHTLSCHWTQIHLYHVTRGRFHTRSWRYDYISTTLSHSAQKQTWITGTSTRLPIHSLRPTHMDSKY